MRRLVCLLRGHVYPGDWLFNDRGGYVEACPRCGHWSFIPQ